jgi:general secretion pathway protein D
VEQLLHIDLSIVRNGFGPDKAMALLSCTNSQPGSSSWLVHWCAKLAAAALVVVCSAAAWGDGFADDPSELAAVLAKKASRAAKAGDLDEAWAYYSQASALQPRNRTYRSRMTALKAHAGRAATAQALSKTGTTAAETRPVAQLSGEAPHAFLPPGILFDSLTASEYAGERQLASPPHLGAAKGRFDFDLNDPPRVLFDKIATRFNLQSIFDSDYPQGGAPVRFRVTQLDYRGALDLLQAATGSFVVPVTSQVFLVARDTQAKRNDLEHYVVLTVRVPQVISPQELTELVQVVRQTTNVEKIGWDTANSQIIIRDRVSRAAPAQALLEQLMFYQPQVMIDLELLEVSDVDMLNYGLTFTNNFPLIYLGGIMNHVATIPTDIAGLLTFGGGRTLIGIAAAEVQALFNESQTKGRSLYASQLRSGSNQAGTFHVGDKYPVITSGYLGITPTNSTPSYVTPPAISYEDLGLEVKATPRIHGSDEVTMAVEASFEVLTGQSANGIPVIARRSINSDIRLRNEEWAVVAGMTGTINSKSSAGVAGLASLPWIGKLFRQTSVDREKSNILIGIRPHILSLPPEEYVLHPLRVGTDAHPYTPL